MNLFMWSPIWFVKGAKLCHFDMHE
jgi:hypothetical protein